MDRGFVEGIQSGEGNNGWQLLLTGTRPNQGQTFGIGYRRSDLMGDALSSRWSVRGTLGGAFLVDGEAQLNRFRQSEDTFAELYAKFERSPRMEFYGLGADTSKADRTGYLLDTGQVDVRAGYRFSRQFNAGVDAGYGHTHTAAVAREDIPSIETTFDATTAPGLFDATSFAMLGGFAGFDTRDLPRGPKHGTFLGVSVNRFKDIDGGRYSHTQVELNGQQFLPYFNATKVVALLVRARFAFTGGDDQVVPFYLQPKLGGNFELRGFAPYRFHDNNSFVASAEHRWYAFSGLEMALFVDAGTTVPSKGSIAIDNLSYSGGFGLRGRLGGAVVVRTDVARSREGWRWIWSMSDVSRRQY
jgi:outer membrane protein assembly factor BamA